MKSKLKILSASYILSLLMGCMFLYPETMALLDEEIAKVHLSVSKGTDDFNDDDILMTISDEADLASFEQAITMAKKSNKKLPAKPDFDIMIEYDTKNGHLPMHAIHLWLGEDGQGSYLSYIDDEELYSTTHQITEKLKNIIDKHTP